MPSIVDIDDTLLRNGTTPIAKVISYVNSLEGSIYIVTGRDARQRPATEKALKDAGVRYTTLVMHPSGTGDINTWKGSVAKRLGGIALAIDNNPDARKAYEAAGVRRVLNPASI